jgi:hypothetical protein
VVARRGTSNGNDRGNNEARKRRKQWLLDWYGDGTTCPCEECGCFLDFETVTVDRIVAGCDGGRYENGNIRPLCGPCNSKLGGALASRLKADDSDGSRDTSDQE